MSTKPYVEAIAYCRYSSHNQDDGNSIEAQQFHINRYANSNNIKVVAWYIDKAFTGRDDKRPEFQNMMDDISTKKYKKAKLVLVHKVDRFARNLDIFTSYLKTLQFRGMKLKPVNCDCSDTAEGKMMMQILAVFAEFYSNNLSNEVKKTMTIIAKNGRHMGGKPLYGYTVDENKNYVIVESEADNVRKMFEMYVDNYSLDKILKELKRRGAKTRKGNDFGKNSLTDLLANEKYIGTFIYNKNSRYQKDGTIDRRKLNPENEIIRVENAIPPILSKELFDRAQQKRMKNKKGVRQKSSKRTYLLTGKVECACCGHSMTGNVHINKQNGKKYEYRAYRCNNQQKAEKCHNKEISATDLESLVIEVLRKKLFNEKVADELFESFQELLKNDENNDKNKITNLKKELKGKETEKENLMLLLDKGRLLDDIFDRIELKNKEIKNIEKSIAELEVNKKELISYKEFKKIIKKANNLLSSENPAIIRELIDKYIEKIVVSNEDVTIFFGYQRSVFKIGAGDGNRTHVVSLEG
ncbi:MAG: recombinase family protein [Longibaculum sp.]